MNKLLRGTVGVVLIVGGSALARANEVTDWNEMLFRASAVASASPLNMTRNSALVEAAVFDAVNGIEKRYTPIHVDPAGPAHSARTRIPEASAPCVKRWISATSGPWISIA